MVGYYITSGVCELVADKKIVQVISQMGDTFKILFAILSTVIVMLIIGFTIILKLTAVI